MCEYCRENNKVMHTEDYYDCKVEVFIEYDQICVNSYQHKAIFTNIYFDFPIRFCPMCGRVL